MDRTGANFENALNDMRKKLGAYAYPIFLPIGKEDYFTGVVDVVNQKAIAYDPSDDTGLKYQITDIPEELKDSAKAALCLLYTSPAQALADEFPIQALNADLNALARQHEPFLKQFASGYYWSLMNRKWKRK